MAIAFFLLCLAGLSQFPPLLLLSSVGGPVEGVEHVKEDERLCDAKVLENTGETLLIVEEEAPVDAEDDKLS